MRTITIHIIDRESSRSLSETIRIDNVSHIEIENQVVRLLNDVPFRKWYFEVETSDELTKEESEVIERIIN